MKMTAPSTQLSATCVVSKATSNGIANKDREQVGNSKERHDRS